MLSMFFNYTNTLAQLDKYAKANSSGTWTAAECVAGAGAGSAWLGGA